MLFRVTFKSGDSTQHCESYKTPNVDSCPCLCQMLIDFQKVSSLAHSARSLQLSDYLLT